ncbi:MFS transporter [Gandjariella thermophila]|uniref:MFS transporter n=1 Tax=Gandjariella thermophila TaxID=1931992 RepID=A0A4D4JB45_9PSEU|nr:MFS transporter [Gandjariella thermophila]GDY31878.1 MFS transporter [Gandjariella thermophila]
MTTERAVGTGTVPAATRRAATVGMVLVVTLAAFEAMGVGTALPTLVADLHGERLYSWPLTTFLAAEVIGTVVSGRVCDRRGPAPALVTGPSLFLVGLLVSGTATAMPALLAGRVLQGLGGGVVVVALYVMIATVFGERDRPRAFAVISACWVVPALVGPTIAGLLTQFASWRWVFLGLAPLELSGILALLLVARRLLAAPEPRPAPVPALADPAAGRVAEPESAVSPPVEPEPATPSPGASRRGLPLAAVAAATGLSALTWAAQHPSLTSLALGAAGLALLLAAVHRLLPPGTLAARPGLATVVLARALLAGTFFGVQAYLPLTLTAVHGWSPAAAGVPLTVGSVGWSIASWWQGRHPDLPRQVLVRRGLLVLAAGVAVAAAVGPHWAPPWLALPAWLLAGMGMGLGTTGVSVLVLRLSPAEDRGFNSAAMQLSDMLGQATFIGLGGVAVATLASPRQPTAAVVPLDLVLAAVALAGAALVTRRVRPTSD